jgi:hypothetical protein
MSGPAVCDYCGVRIVWGKDEHGVNIPLDPRAPVYQYANGTATIIPLDGEGNDRVRTVMVSHYSTCSKVTRKGQPHLPLGPGGQPK